MTTTNTKKLKAKTTKASTRDLIKGRFRATELALDYSSTSRMSA